MASGNVQYIFEIVDRYSSTLKKMDKELKNFRKNTEDTNKKIMSFKKSLKNIGDKAGKVGKKLTTRVTLPILAFGAAIVKASSTMEDMRVRFESITGSSEKAANAVKQIATFTAKTPFQLEEVANAARKLLVAGVPLDKINDRLMILGDISASSGKDLNSLARIFARVKEKGKAQMEEMNMLSEAGIPIIAQLAKTFGVTKAEVFELSTQGKISFNIMKKALINMNSEGGFAFKSMDRLSKTLSGRLSTLKDNIILTSASIGNTILPKLKELVTKITIIVQKIDEFVKLNPKIVKLTLTIAGLVAILGPLLLLSKGILIILSAINLPVILISATIAGLAVIIIYLIKNWEKVKKAFSEYKSLIVIKNIFMYLVAMIQTLIKYTLQFTSLVNKPFKFLGDKVKKIFTAKIDTQSKNQVNGAIDVTLNSQKGTVKKTSVSSSNKSVKLGLNNKEAI